MPTAPPPAGEPVRQVDVAVIGCGPVGALTANLLGVRGISTLVVERSEAAHGQPRAFSCDDEALRIYQQAGLLEQISRDTYPPSLVEYVNRAGRVFASVALSEIDFGYGHRPLHFFDQPLLEQTLRRGLDRFAHVEFRQGTELVSLRQDDEWVTLTLRGVRTGESWTVRARYVLGCDGARSTTRQATGIPLDGASYAEPWLAVSGDVVPDAVRVPHTTFVCDWQRPAFVSPGARGSYRMEFMLRPGETEETFSRPQAVTPLLEPYVDPAGFTVTRAATYVFHHLIAQRWRHERVFLLGDAAHQMPPFMGQGLCSGLRDAANLSWKLALVLSGGADARLLDTYETERRPHTVAMAQTSVRLGRVFLARNRFAAWARDSALRAVQAIPRVRRFVRHFEFKPVPAYQRGLMAGGRRRDPVGTMFPQPYVASAKRPDPHLLDEELGAGFAVLGPPGAFGAPWRGLPVRFVTVHPSGTDPESLPFGRLGDAVEHIDVVDATGAVTEWLHHHRSQLVILRPDRFVYGTGAAGHIDHLRRDLLAALWG
ncbi:bifunctional 3-(3-hydroxy-phenyl)propionate/3-hydroxycinnamic acid hydroxylase [Phytohabitans flavus]|uniref:3-(3-hydroxy-phenyl)propionate/3-hydroxycinnamic acid hydroxylase n=1 Tax=Phytohabitans flavus TaxID=1076124 RepID=A0A6F8XRA1_9ACTN|nr:bifunctional 3-(3-hydroxy-phenyl)propionate/3-hydroxycinnamic acid hydroxylase [Phytohabitans flavus]BCB76372.1 3-(3-hydroxy-phenyl)propionate/3-hydroxycinnamic acid hydroxylase [Phytohabitans flavus]